MLELKEYQEQALQALVRWRDALADAEAEYAPVVETLRKQGAPIPAELMDNPRRAWEALRATGGVASTAGAYVARTDGAGRPIPHVCFKVPTGGGKTLLAASALGRLNKQSGLVLWIVPSSAIYEQTMRALKNREHPYRETLAHAAGGTERVKVLEKNTRFTLADTANYLCVMLLMYQATSWNRSREFLRMFRDSGDYPSFFPDNDDLLADGPLLQSYPDLELACTNPECAARLDKRARCNCGDEWKNGPVKHSLYNALKILRPVVILDEAHKTYGKPESAGAREFVRNVSRLDPRMVIELSATPNRGISNLLVDITGLELKQEEMIKLPVQVTANNEPDWPVTLGKAKERLDELDRDAESLQYQEGRHIRPIAVVRVERTGADQRDGEHIHAEDVREYLELQLDVRPEEIAVKSTATDELAGQDLLSPLSPVRWIITRAALMEGWDCPFAYVLVMLDNTRAAVALTQLVGRVMRQPHARRTGREALDQCYVYCMNTAVQTAVAQVKAGLENEGLTGLGPDVVSSEGEVETITITRREAFRTADIFLPTVLHRSGGKFHELDYQRDILPAIDWDSIDAGDPQSYAGDPVMQVTAAVDIGNTPVDYGKPEELFIDKTIAVAWFARRLGDVVPNAWQAARLAEALIDRLRGNGLTDDAIYDHRPYYAYALREHVWREADKQAKGVFERKLKAGDIQFDLEAGKPRFTLAQSYKINLTEGDGIMTGRHGQQLKLNLFEPMYTSQFDSDLERNFARYLDELKALQWWHRVAVRQRGDYYLRGWRQDRIWPDFIALKDGQYGQEHLLVFETKGAHLKGHDDTTYKEAVLKALESAFTGGTMTIRDGPARGTFRLVFSEDFPSGVLSQLDL